MSHRGGESLARHGKKERDSSGEGEAAAVSAVMFRFGLHDGQEPEEPVVRGEHGQTGDDTEYQ